MPQAASRPAPRPAPQTGPQTGNAGEPAPRFSIGPLTLHASAADMERWFAGAVYGDEMIYATGPVLSPAEAGPKLARAWCDDRLVILFKRRREGDGAWQHYARRTAMKPGQAEAARRAEAKAQRQRKDEIGPLGQRVLDYLTKLASAGHDLPSGEDMAADLGLKGRFAVQYQLERLERLNAIAIKPARARDGRDGRAITITATQAVLIASSGRAGRGKSA